ncbi:carbohydrate ABC transporter permease [Mangrovicoccus algicola]|uniref:Carbohydrate ABC transporter permease n=1 Tax=Mangrovicoccus algicola TaxID=2771008 RepID=A0A8J7CW38_9RHOB|nr:carbohydrate ABC transporter permease [Mangrovicoccus algicola]MBE3637287.1 carbohydrate ABC transporter permease [Mangrovicoccus algicola]
MTGFLTRTRGKTRMDVTDILAFAWLILGTLVIAIPIGWAFLSSFKPEAEINSFPPTLMPRAAETLVIEGYDDPLPAYAWTDETGETRTVGLIRRIGLKATVVDPDTPGERLSVDAAAIEKRTEIRPEWSNYTDPLERFAFLTYLKNSVFVTVVATVMTLVLNSMAAFALSKYRFRGSTTIFVLMLSTLMLPLSVIMVPAFMVIVGLNLADNLWGVIFSTVATPTGVFLLRQYMLTIPDDLIEAARVDAASEFRIYWRIILPLSAPALAVLAIFSVIWRWNDFLWPLIVLSSPENYTLQLGLNAFQGQFTVQWHYILSMTVVALLPVTLIFLFLQRYITEGVASSGVK